jgi:hypothetical protein
MTRPGSERRARDIDVGTRANDGTARMRVLAERHPELAAFTPDATLTEIKIRYGLNTFDQVLEFRRRKRQRR